MDLNYDSVFYRALVVNNEDPENLCRIQVRIPQYHGIPGSGMSYVIDKDLPWAVPAVMLGNGIGSGNLILPSVGSIVFVSLENNNMSRPIYFGTIPLASNGHSIDGISEGSYKAKLAPKTPSGYRCIYRTRTNYSILEHIETGRLYYSDGTNVTELGQFGSTN